MRNWATVLAMATAGYALTLYVFFPGVMTYDAKYIYIATKAAQPGDWQSPVMVAIWKWIDPLAPGAASMFLLIVTIYWLAFGLLALSLAPRSPLIASGLLVLAALPPAFTLLGIIWRDILFAAAWLLAVVLAWCARERALAIRVPGANHRAWFRRAWNPAAAECAVRDSDSRDLYPLADGVPARSARPCSIFLWRSPSTRWCRWSITAR